MAADLTPVRILFLCVGNAVRSQMAEGFARALGGERVEARSAGSAAAGFVAPKAVEVMRERGVDISAQESKGIDWAFMEDADVVVSTCAEAEAACPVPFRADTLRWNVPDPSGQGIEAYRAVRGEVEAKVRALLKDLAIPQRSLPGAAATPPEGRKP